MRGNAPAESGRAAAGKTSWRGCPACLEHGRKQKRRGSSTVFLRLHVFSFCFFGWVTVSDFSGNRRPRRFEPRAGLSRNAAQEMKRPGCPACFLGGIRKQDARKMKTGGEKMVFRFWRVPWLGAPVARRSRPSRPGKKMTGLPGPFSGTQTETKGKTL